jgi:hypothetical protein
VIAAQPYRFTESVELDVRYPDDMRGFLAASNAPAIRAARIN